MKPKPLRLAIAQTVCRYLPPIISQWIREVIYPRELAYSDGFQVTVRAQTGSLYSGNTADHHIYPFSVHGYYYWRAWAIAIAVCSAGDTIVEVGANVGTETIGFSDIVGRSGRVIAFEPLLANIAALSSSLKKAKWQNISLQPVAVGDANETVLFSAPVLAQNSGIGYIVRDAEKTVDGLVEVKCVTLDTFWGKEVSPRLVFMDVEGFEIKVLRGAREMITQHAPIRSY
jgi:FkbM family methyltransferase